jgi:hypothetical protein
MRKIINFKEEVLNSSVSPLSFEQKGKYGSYYSNKINRHGMYIRLSNHPSGVSGYTSILGHERGFVNSLSDYIRKEYNGIEFYIDNEEYPEEFIFLKKKNLVAYFDKIFPYLEILSPELFLDIMREK